MAKKEFKCEMSNNDYDELLEDQGNQQPIDDHNHYHHQQYIMFVQ